MVQNQVPLGECNDEQVLAEVARRNLDLHDKITDALVRETYDIGRVIGSGASGQVFKVKHKTLQKHYACKVVRKDASMNDAQSMSTEIEIMKRIRHRYVRRELHTCIHMHSYIHAFIHACIHTCVHSYMHAFMNSFSTTHRHIVSMYELYETPKCLWIILELVDGGDIHHFLANIDNYTEV